MKNNKVKVGDLFEAIEQNNYHWSVENRVDKTKSLIAEVISIVDKNYCEIKCHNSQYPNVVQYKIEYLKDSGLWTHLNRLQNIKDGTKIIDILNL